MGYRVDPAADTPPSRQIVEAVLDAVASGDLVPGDQLLSVRGMAAEALVNPNTVAKAYRELTHLRVVEARNGSGVFVTGKGPKIARESRRASTLVQLERAVREAQRSGHDGEEIRDAVESALEPQGKQTTGKKRKPKGRRSA